MAAKEISQIHKHIKIQMHDDEIISNQIQQQKIQKVPQLLRGIQSNRESDPYAPMAVSINNGSDPYAPMVVSIGPYHHGKPELEEMEKLKLEFASKYFPDSSEEMYTTTIKADEARKFYSDGSIPTKFNDEKFSKMMFLDGCFILHFISSFLSQKGTRMKLYLESYVIRDLFLLENQLPFSVLELLMNSSKGYSEKEEEYCTLEKIKKFIGIVRRSSNDDKKSSCKSVCKKFASKCNEMLTSKVTNLCSPSKTNTKDPKNEILKPPLHLVELFHTQFRERNPIPSGSKSQGLYRFRSAKALNNFGIHFKPSKSSNFDDVNYDSYLFYGYLSLPTILVDELSKSLLLNLAAYEACPDTPDDAFQVSSYIVFLNSLIDHAEDVKELRSKGILLNSLGSDQDVADLFNEISKYLVIHPDAFWKARDDIDECYQSNFKKWITEWLSDHFSSPWTVLAFLGASIGLGLTAIETYNSFKQNK